MEKKYVSICRVKSFAPNHMKKISPAMFLAMWLCLASCLVGQDTSNDRSSKPTSTKPEFVKSAAPDYSKEPYIFELIQTKVRFEMDGKGQRELTIRARVQSESAVRELGLLTYPFASSFESLDVIYVRVRKPDGSVVETPQSDVQELDSAVSREAPMYSDTREKHIAVKSLGVGDVLEAQLRWTVHVAVAPGHFWGGNSFFRAGICLKEIKEFDLPKSAAAKVTSKEAKPTIEQKGDRQIYRFETSNLNKAEEPKIPDWEKNYYGIDPPDVRVSSFHSWDDVGAWYAQLQETKIAVTPEIKAKAEELTKGKTSEEDKTRALYDFVSTHFRYIGVDLGVGRYAPHSAGDVLANRYGDCKDKHTLFAALMSAVGLKAYPALISSRFRVDPAFPSPELFDHVITAIPRGDSYSFLDTTPEVAPFGLLLAGLRDRQALVMAAGAPAKLQKTPAEAPFHSFENVSIDSSIDTDGTLDATMRVEIRGDREVALRSVYRNTPQNRWDELTQALVNGMGFAGKSSEISVSPPEDTTKPFVVSFKYHRTGYPDWKNRQISLPLPALLLPELNDEQKVSKNPLPLGPEQDFNYTATVKLPKDYAAEVPTNISRKTDFAEFTAEYAFEKKDGVLLGTLRWKTLRPEALGSEREKYVEIAKSISDAQSHYIPISGTTPIALVTRDLAVRTSTNPNQAIPELETILSKQPENEAASLMLATAYLETGRAKDAAALREKSVAKHPQNAMLRTSLGAAYLKVPNVDKAMEQFEKAIDSDPDPMVLNEAAYALADEKLKLEEAESYSRQAINRLSEESMEIELQDADKDDFVLMDKLAMNWDTMGWIKFQAGDIESAEKFVEASWDLVQNPLVGEHLVEIYEKEGKPHRAATICTMALAGYGHEQVQDKLTQEMKRLRTYLKGGASSDGSLALSDIRTLHVSFQTKLADNSRWMHVTIAMTAGEKLAQVAYVSGAEELKKATGVLANLKYPQTFPDTTPARILRKAIFSCSVYTKDCTLVLTPTLDAAAGN